MSQSAERSLDVLECLVASDQALGAMEVAARTGLDKSTVSRLLGLLVARQLAVRDPYTRRFDVGPSLIALATAALRRSDLRKDAAKFIAHLRDLTGETVSLHLRLGSDRVCVDGLESTDAIRRSLPLFERLPLYEGPSGKVILAHLPPPERAEIVDRAAQAGCSRAKLEGQLAKARAQGGLMTTGDRTPGVAAISCPIHGPSGVMASITVAGPGYRWTNKLMRKFFPEVREAAIRITEAMQGVWVTE